MREIIHLQIGSCGNRIGKRFWGTLLAEHGIDPSTGSYFGNSDVGLTWIDAYLNETIGGRYVPRALMVDLEPGPIDEIRAGSLGKIFSPDNFLTHQYGAANCWAQGMYTTGRELIDQIMDVVRKEAEFCDALQGFQILHALGGGTGSGLGSLVLLRIREEYPDRLVFAFPVLPSPKASESVVEPYNATLAMHYLVEYADAVVCLDNDALYDLAAVRTSRSSMSYYDFNHLAENAVTGITAWFRFPGQVNNNLVKMAVNLIPFPRLKFLIPSFAPQPPRASLYALSLPTDYRALTVSDLIHNLFHPHNALTTCAPHSGRCITAATLFRGKVSMSEVDDQLVRVKTNGPPNFVQWIPDNIQSSVCAAPQRGFPMSASLLGNSGAIHTRFKDMANQFHAMFRRKCFLKPYSSAGMDEMEMGEAVSNMEDLMDEYQRYSVDNYCEDEHFE